jgi:hypothetical protein
VNDRLVLNGIFWVSRSTLHRSCQTTSVRTYLLRSLRSLATTGVWAKIMNALAAAHDAVQMIDTSIVRLHQYQCLPASIAP